MCWRIMRTDRAVLPSGPVSVSLVALLLAACSSKAETLTVPGPDTTAPLVLFTAPAAGATAVAVNGAVMAVFSETMQAASLGASTVTLSSPGGAVSGTVTVSGDARGVTFTPAAALAPATPYIAAINTEAKDAAGNPLGFPVTWSFTTAASPDVTAPRLREVTPVAGAELQPADVPITATFDEPIDCTTVDASSFQLYEEGLLVPGYASCAGATIRFHPLPFAPTNTILLAVIEPIIADLAGNRIEPYSWAFGMRPWTRQLGTASEDGARGVATDGAGNVFVAGFTDGALDGQASAGEVDLFVAKYDGNGVKLWTRQLGTASNDFAQGVATDGAGNAFVAGFSGGVLDGQASAGGDDVFVVKYDGDGGKLWTRQLGTGGTDAAYAVATDGAGNVFVAGFTSDALDGQASAGGFVAKYDGAGVKLWTRQLGTTSFDYAHGVATDGAGNVFVAGLTYGALDGQASAGGGDLFVAKYDGNGVKLWTRQLGTASNDFAQGVATDGAGNVFVAGYTWGALDGQASAGGSDLFVAQYQSSGRKR